MYDLICWSVMGLHANPDPPFDGKETRLTNPQRPAPIPEINQAGGAALQTGMPVFRPAPPAKMVVGTGQDGCRSSPYRGGVGTPSILREKRICHMSKSAGVPFEPPSEFSPDPLAEGVQAGAGALLPHGHSGAGVGFHRRSRAPFARGRPPASGAPQLFAGARGDDRHLFRCRACVTAVQMRMAARSRSGPRWFRPVCARRSRPRNYGPGFT